MKRVISPFMIEGAALHLRQLFNPSLRCRGYPVLSTEVLCETHHWYWVNVAMTNISVEESRVPLELSI